MMAFYLPVIGILAGADQLTKYWARISLSEDRPWVLSPFLEFILHFNSGGAFSILSDGYVWQQLFLLIASIAVSLILLLWLYRMETRFRLGVFGLLLLLAGALGNLIDRALFGKVTDFIAVHWHAHYFPTFNLADSMISIGVTLFILHVYLNEGTST
jgi:signal peptidase II